MKKTNPTLSIIIPCLNEEVHLPLLLNDLSLQTRDDFEIIIVDGHSNDHTLERISKYKDKLTNLIIINSEVRNVSHQRNLGAHKAKAAYFLFMDADNRFDHRFINNLVTQLSRFSPDVFSTLIAPDSHLPWNIIITYLIDLYFIFQNRTDKPTTLESMLGFKKETFALLGGFDPKLHWGEGGALLEKAAKKGFPLRLLKSPRYRYSLRRFQGGGAIKSLLNVVRLEISRLLGLKVNAKKIQEIYPMEGGQSHPLGQ